jgi:hypothetical protein
MFNRNVLFMLIIVLLAISCCPLCKATGNEDLKISGAANDTWVTVPLNTAVVAGKQATFTCITSLANGLIWAFTADGQSGYVLIVNNCVVNPPYTDRYALTNIGPGRCDLVVLSATNAEAGLYGCQAGFELTATALLAVLASEPICTSEVTEPVAVGDKVIYTCEVSYTSNISPMLMSWTNTEGQPIPSYTNNTVAGRSASSISVAATWPDVTSHHCKSYFSAPSNLPSTATNTPEYSHVWNSTVYNVITPGVTYYRWGRTTCGNGSEVVYKGYMAGAHYSIDFVGSGANYLCVPENPQPGPGNVAGIQQASGRLYGVEYQLNDPYGPNQPFSFENNGGQSLQYQDAVCALCHRPKRSSNAMMPGRQDCLAGNSDWILEYKGYLMSAHHSGIRTEYVCVDEAPEARPGGEAINFQSTFDPVQAVCGTLPCPPYIQGDEVTCAVCSR